MGRRRQKLDQYSMVVSDAYCVTNKREKPQRDKVSRYARRGLEIYAEQGSTVDLHEKVRGSFPFVAFLFPMLINKVIDFLIQWLNNHRQEALELVKEFQELNNWIFSEPSEKVLGAILDRHNEQREDVPEPILIIDPVDPHEVYQQFAMDVALENMECFNATESIRLGIDAAIEFKKQWEACGQFHIK